MRKPIAFALAAALCVAGCSEQPQGKGSRVHPSAQAAPPTARTLQAPVPPDDPHAVDRATTPSDYCVGCHVGFDDANNHPVRVSLAAAALGDGYFYPPASPAIVLRDGVFVECSSCHDDGSAGFHRRTVLADLCGACHAMGASDPPPFAVVTSPAAGAVVRGAILVTASVTDDQGVVRAELWGGASPYELALLQSLAQPSATVTFRVDTAALPNGPYTFLVRAFDAAGGNDSSLVSVTIDNAAELSVTLQSPAAGAVVRGYSSVVGLAPGAARVELWAGPTPEAAALVSSAFTATGGTFILPLDTRALPDGATALAVRAFDAYGRTGSAGTAIVIDNSAPPVAIVSPASGALVRGALEVVASVGDAALADLLVGPTPETARAVAFSGGIAAEVARLSFDTAGVPDGLQHVVVRARDAAGNEGTAARPVTVDNTPPAVAITSPAAGANVRGTVQISAAASDANGVASVAFLVDGVLLRTVTAAPYVASWTPVRRSGAHVLVAVATDRAGNTATSAPVTVAAR